MVDSVHSDPLRLHVKHLHACRRCPAMHAPPVSGQAIHSKVILVGQAPGVKEPLMGRPFAWTAGKTLFRWFSEYCGVEERIFRERIYMAAVCRCFPGKNPGGGDRVPDADEIRACSHWMEEEFKLLSPSLVVPVGKLAIAQFLEFKKLTEVIGPVHKEEKFGKKFDLIALPHPSGASTWHRMEPGRVLLAHALREIAKHPAFKASLL